MRFIKMPEDKRCKNSKEISTDITLNRNVFTLVEKQIFFFSGVRKVGTNEKKLLRYVQAVIMVILAVSLNKNIPHYLTV